MTRGILALALAGCVGSGGKPDTGAPSPGGGGGDTPSGPTYDSIAAELATYRTRFLGEEADELYPRGEWLFWLTFPGYDPVLHGWDRATGEEHTYGFPIGSTDYTYRASDQLIVTADTDGSGAYRAYDIRSPQSLLGEIELPPPSNGTRWHAYAADGDAVYVVVAAQKTSLYRWIPPGDPEKLWTFEDLGYDLGAFQDFDVTGDEMIFVESGRIWRADVETGAGEWLGNPTQVSGVVSYDAEGVVWSGDYSLYWYDYDGPGQVVNLTDAINAADYQMTADDDSAHQIVETGFSRVGDRLVYESLSGIFLYDLQAETFQPLILEDRQDPDLRVTWRDPVLMDDGTLFATGLESTSGSVGAEGPVWRIDHPALIE